MSKQFQKRIEDFNCEHCNITVKGNGYTNHCPNCLWSKHVDIYPGDRAHTCEGLMEPIGVQISGKESTIVHRCNECRAVRRNKSSKGDNFDALVEIS